MENLEQFLGPGTAVGENFYWGALIFIAIWEFFRPLRPLEYSLPVRWINNIALAIFNVGFVKILTVLLAFDFFIFSGLSEFGLLNAFQIPFWAAVLLGVLWLDFVSYATHRLMHAIPPLWRLHRLHHSDPEVDFTTSERHHPLIVFFTAPTLAAGMLAVGAPPLALAIWWAVSGVISLFQHGNVRLPRMLDQWLRLFLVTPAMHRAHHSSNRSETDSNYGQVFPWWDHMFRTYCPRPEGGLTEMELGLKEFRRREDLFLHRLLLQPFVKTETGPGIGLH